MDTKLFARHQPGGMFSIVDRQWFPEGNIWWVDSGETTNGADSAGHGKNPDSPFLTLAYAKSAASAGDTIFVMPGHTETLSSATGAAVLTVNLARLKIIGLGGMTTKPTFLIDGHASNYVTVTAADVVFENLCFKAGHADIVKGFNVAAAGCEFRNCQFLENDTAENFLVTIQTTAAGDDLKITGCTFDGVTQATECVELVGANNRAVITDNKINGLFSVSAISNITAACLGIDISRNYIANHTTAGNDLAGAIDLNGNATGWICDNRIYLGDDTDCLTAIDGGYCVRGGNLAMNEYEEEGGTAGAAST